MPDDEGLREELAEAIWDAADGYMSHVPWERARRNVFREAKALRQADAVLPVVERYGRKCAEEALQQAAAAPYVWTTDGPAIPRYELERRAEALGRTEAET